ncbi:hypothetical protein Q1W71_21415 [Flavobacterium pectinovorum]|uniref:hypothetical protein n=1 Tax=Flavobacterium pectinovorum TaxID=29533 RepID=UPI00265E9FAF|nr:hypothetical protein [Flavobacterium pectinovorum]WKL47504.1 hypothetical protein Q1W71_21415 [Flavobacterium pectinovorum]
MNWIIQHTEKLEFHTDLKELLKPILADIKDFTWVISDFDFIGNKSLPINYERDFFVLSSDEFGEILNSEMQLIWGVVSGFPKDKEIIIEENDLPYSEGNDLIWKNENFQLQNSVIEIIEFDSFYSIIKFRDEKTSYEFKKHFDEAIELEKFIYKE